MSAPDRIWVDGDSTGRLDTDKWGWDSGCWGHQPERQGEEECLRCDGETVKGLVEALKGMMNLFSVDFMLRRGAQVHDDIALSRAVLAKLENNQ